MNPIRKLSAAFNRAKTNHKRKLVFGVPNGSLAAAAATGIVLSPFDAGITLYTVAGAALMNLGLVIAEDERAIRFYDNDTIVKMKHEGQEYYVTSAQKELYQRAESEIKHLETQYESYADSNMNGKAKKVERKARKFRQFQYDIMESKNVRLVDAPRSLPKMNLDMSSPARKGN